MASKKRNKVPEVVSLPSPSPAFEDAGGPLVRPVLTVEQVLANFPFPEIRPQQKDAIEQVVKSYNDGKEYVLLEAPVGCHARGTLILMANGERVAVEDLRVGDFVMGWKGPQQITSLARGRQPMARIVPVKGDPFVVNTDHILTLVNTSTDEVIDIKVSQLLERSAWFQSEHKLFRASVGAFEGSRDFFITPYVLGVFLGDGGLTNGNVRVHKADQELREPLEQLCSSINARWGFALRVTFTQGDTWNLTQPRGSGTNPIALELHRMKLDVESARKFVPPEYLRGSLDDRLNLLAGLLDTDGSLTCGGYDFISASYDLADGVTFLARSVGLAAYMKQVEKSCQNGFTGTYWRVSISGDCSTVPCRIERKKAPPRQQKKDVLRTGFSIELLPEDDFFGFSLDGDGRFLLGDFTVTHNTGKSPIAIALARSIGQAFFVTLTEQLQDQYMKDFSHYGLRALKGRGKYQCANAGGSCALGRTLKLKCPTCPYVAAKNMAVNSPFAVANYHSFLANLGGAEGQSLLDRWRALGLSMNSEDEGVSARPRMLAIWDEAHTIEAFLLDQMGLDVDLAKLGIQPTVPMPESMSNTNLYFDYLRDHVIPLVATAIEGTVDPHEKEALELFSTAAEFALSRRDVDEWIPERPELPRSDRLDPDKFSLRPLKIDAYAHWLWGWADFNIFMSGTILSAWQFVRNLGLDPEKGDHITVPSPFPAKNRQIFAGDLNMKFKARAESWPKMVKEVERILSHHPHEKGLLLCPSNEMIQTILKGIVPSQRSRVLIASGEKRLDVYKQHLSGTAPTVLAAPGLWEGADLKGDASRFQILPAVPRAFFKGQVAARAKADPGWYRWLNYTKLLQGTGRSIRTEDDYAVTYILDEEFAQEMARSDSLIPAWVKEAVTVGLPAMRPVTAPTKVFR